MVQEAGYNFSESDDVKVYENVSCIWKGMFQCSKHCQAH